MNRDPIGTQNGSYRDEDEDEEEKTFLLTKILKYLDIFDYRTHFH